MLISRAGSVGGSIALLEGPICRQRIFADRFNRVDLDSTAFRSLALAWVRHTMHCSLQMYWQHLTIRNDAQAWDRSFPCVNAQEVIRFGASASSSPRSPNSTVSSRRSSRCSRNSTRAWPRSSGRRPTWTRYRASVLKAAVDGRLTEQWHRENPSDETGAELLRRILAERRKRWEEEQLANFEAKGRKPPRNWKAKYKEPVEPDTRNLRELPDGWCWATVDQLGRVIGGLTKNPARRNLSLRLPYLRVANVYADEMRLDDIRTIGVTKAELDRVSLLSGDLLIVEGNGSADQIGRVALWDGTIKPCVHQNHLIKVRFGRYIRPRWPLMWLLSPAGRSTVLHRASSTSGLHTLSLSKVRSLPIPLPPRLEQAEAERVASTLRDATQIVEGGLGAGTTRADALRQSILKRAFEGRLVPQDPADEPASVLFDRIRAQRRVRS